MKLDGFRVLDLSLFLPGPHLTMMMADHGADVIKLEPFHEGEPVRHIGWWQEGSKHSVWFRNTHRGKRSLKLNLKAPEGKELFFRLVDHVDVIVEAFRPGVVDRLGVGWAAVKARNPKVVYCSISAFGQSGPYRDKPAHDVAIEAMTGYLAVNEGQDGKPAMPHVPAADMIASQMAFAAILMALLRRTKTGLGDYIDLSMHDALLSWTPNNTGPVFAEHRANVPKMERSWGGAAMYNIYPTRDGKWIVLGGSEIKFAENLFNALGRPEFIEHCRKQPGADQIPAKQFLTETFATRSLAEWVEFLTPLDVCWAPLKNLKDAFDDPNTWAREMRVKDPDGFDHIGIPMKFTEEPGRIDFKLPDFGEHSKDIAAELGYSADQIAALASKGVI